MRAGCPEEIQRVSSSAAVYIPTSVMSAQNQAIQVKIDSLKAATVVTVTAAKATIASVRPPGTHKKDKQNDNDISATTTHPYKQKSIRWYTHDNYCYTCGFDITTDYSSVNFKWKGPNHNDAATVTNRLGGISKNRFHCKGNFTALWCGRTEHNNNKTNITKIVVDKNIPISLCDNISSRSITSKNLLYAAVLQQNTIRAIIDTAALGTYGPVEVEKTGILFPHEPIEVTCANELNMRSVSTIIIFQFQFIIRLQSTIQYIDFIPSLFIMLAVD